MLGWISFFSIIIFSIVIGILIMKNKHVAFADIMTAFMASLLSFAFDMLFCKQFETYSYVDIKYKGINSFLISLTVFPSISLMFTSYLPKNKKNLPIYILLWSLFLTIFELIVKPLNIVLYSGWKIVPWSFILYVLVFSLLSYYRDIIKKYST